MFSGKRSPSFWTLSTVDPFESPEILSESGVDMWKNPLYGVKPTSSSGSDHVKTRRPRSQEITRRDPAIYGVVASSPTAIPRTSAAS
jgi:hypothetical protein